MDNPLNNHNPSPLVSVIIPVYNGERYLPSTIQSVLLQDYRPLEIIVVDDGSTDRTAQIAQGFSDVIYLYQSNQGPGSARNLGIQKSKGEMIAFLDGDDLWMPNKLTLQVKYLLDNPEIGFVIAHMRPVIEEDVEWPPSLNRSYYEQQPPCYLPSALLVRRAVLFVVGLFDPSYRHANDSDWFFRAKEAGIKMGIIPEVLVEKRIHSANLSHEKSVTYETMMAVRASLQRRKENS